MPLDEDGQFYRLFNWENDRDSGVPILAERMDQEMDGVIRALNDILRGKVAFQGQMRISEGSADSPALSFDKGGETGFYRRLDGNIALAVDGEEIGVLSARFFKRKIEAGVGLRGGGEPGEDLVLSLDYATSQDALSGTDDVKAMTPLRTKEMLREAGRSLVGTGRRIAAGAGLRGGGSLGEDLVLSLDYATSQDALNGTDDVKAMTPLRTKEMLRAASLSFVGTGRPVAAGAGLRSRGSLGEDLVFSLDYATSQDALNGTDDVKAMTPLRTKEMLRAASLSFVGTGRPVAAGAGLRSRGSLGEDLVLSLDYATSQDALNGTDDVKAMTPLRTKEMLRAASLSFVGTGRPVAAGAGLRSRGSLGEDLVLSLDYATPQDALNGTDDVKAMTPLRTKEMLLEASRSLGGLGRRIVAGVGLRSGGEPGKEIMFSLDYALSQDALSGLDSVKVMTPLRTTEMLRKARRSLVGTERRIAAGAGLQGGGSLGEDLVLSLDYATPQDALNGTDDVKAMTPLRTTEMLRKARRSLVGTERRIAAGAGLQGGGSLGEDLVLSLDYATSQDALSGTDDVKAMTPLRTKEMLLEASRSFVGTGRPVAAGAGLRSGGSLGEDLVLSLDYATSQDALIGADDVKAMTPLRTKEMLREAGRSFVGTGRRIAAGAGLQGGGALGEDLVLSLDYATPQDALNGTDDVKAMTPLRTKEMLLEASRSLGGLGRRIVAGVGLRSGGEPGKEIMFSLDYALSQDALSGLDSVKVMTPLRTTEMLRKARRSLVGTERRIAAGAGLQGGGALGEDLVLSLDYATSQDALSGTDDVKAMTPLRTKEMLLEASRSFVGTGRPVAAGAGLRSGGSLGEDLVLSLDYATSQDALIGADDVKAMTPLRTKEMLREAGRSFVGTGRRIAAGAGLQGGGALGEDLVLSLDYATPQDALNGTDDVKAMTPLRTKEMLLEASRSLGGLGRRIVAGVGLRSGGEPGKEIMFSLDYALSQDALSGLDSVKVMTPLRTKEMLRKARRSLVGTERRIAAGAGLQGGGALGGDLVLSLDYATSRDALNGADDVKAMTPLRTKEMLLEARRSLVGTERRIAAGAGLQGGGALGGDLILSLDYATSQDALSGTDDVKAMTPLRTKEMLLAYQANVNPRGGKGIRFDVLDLKDDSLLLTRDENVEYGGDPERRVWCGFVPEGAEWRIGDRGHLVLIL